MPLERIKTCPPLAIYKRPSTRALAEVMTPVTNAGQKEKYVLVPVLLVLTPSDQTNNVPRYLSDTIRARTLERNVEETLHRGVMEQDTSQHSEMP